MARYLDKPWRPLTEEEVTRLPGQLGVYEICDAEGATQYIGYAGGRSLFGLREALQAECAKRPAESRFRIEITMQYQSRWRELLMVYQAANGELPRDNRDGDVARRLGRLSP